MNRTLRTGFATAAVVAAALGLTGGALVTASGAAFAARRRLQAGA